MVEDADTHAGTNVSSIWEYGRELANLAIVCYSGTLVADAAAQGCVNTNPTGIRTQETSPESAVVILGTVSGLVCCPIGWDRDSDS